MGEVIPDLVYVGFHRSPNQALWPRHWTFRHSFVLWLLRGRHRLHGRMIARLCYESEERIVALLEDLQKCGAITLVGSRCYSLSKEMAGVKACVVAVETKLKRWRDALEQASMYRRFADESIVVMAGNNVPSEDRDLRLFRRTGVGLCATTPRGLLWIVVPRRSRSVGVEKEYLMGSAARDGQTLWSCL